jgi:hypothetical protein
MDGGHDPVITAGEPPEHPPGLRVVSGLAEDRVAQENERIGCEHPVTGAPRRGDRGLLGSETGSCGAAGLARRDRLVDVRRIDRERDAEGRQNLRPARGGRGEDEAGHHPVILRPIPFLSFRGAKRRGIFSLE